MACSPGSSWSGSVPWSDWPAGPCAAPLDRPLMTRQQDIAAARAASIAGDLDRAEALWRTLLADAGLLAADRARAHSGLGFVLARRGALDAALAAHAAAADLLPGEAACHAKLGSAR